MGACYSVSYVLRFSDEQGAIKALQNQKFMKTKANTMNGLMKFVLADNQNPVTITSDGKFTRYENDFDASYGWETLLQDTFEVMKPFLKKRSKVVICPDNEKYTLYA